MTGAGDPAGPDTSVLVAADGRHLPSGTRYHTVPAGGGVPPGLGTVLSGELGTPVVVTVDFPYPGGPGAVIVRDDAGREVSVRPELVAAVIERLTRTAEEPRPAAAARALMAFDKAATPAAKVAVFAEFLASR